MRSLRGLSGADCCLAKHLEQLKGGRFPIEVLVRGKDASENEKLFIKVTNKIKEAGVSESIPIVSRPF